jgi:hypothetical protein
MSEKFQGYSQKPQRNCTFMNSISEQALYLLLKVAYYFGISDQKQKYVYHKIPRTHNTS